MHYLLRYGTGPMDKQMLMFFCVAFMGWLIYEYVKVQEKLKDKENSDV